MSYVALATDRFDDVVRFYGEVLGFAVESAWDRPGARGTRFAVDGQLRLEILDNGRESPPLTLEPPGDRVHVVVEVPDVRDTHARLHLDVPGPVATSWGATWFRVRDPDEIAVTFLQWGGPACTA